MVPLLYDVAELDNLVGLIAKDAPNWEMLVRQYIATTVYEYGGERLKNRAFHIGLSRCKIIEPSVSREFSASFVSRNTSPGSSHVDSGAAEPVNPAPGHYSTTVCHPVNWWYGVVCTRRWCGTSNLSWYYIFKYISQIGN